MFLSVSESLPTTSYIKMIEVWLVFSMLIPFLQVLILTFIHLNTPEESPAKQSSLYTVKVHPRDENDEVMSNNVKRHSSLQIAIFMRDFFVPILILVFAITYMTVGLLVAKM